jgi:UDP-N-acetylmuramoyl-tripeptide--D-alanyl-D-alanine ligase
VGVSHVEILGTEEAIASAKGELVHAVPPSGRVFLNGDDGWSDTLAASSCAGLTRYGLGPTADVRAEDVVIAADGTPSFTLVAGDSNIEIRLPVLGRHNVYNALAAAAVALYLELPPDDIAAGLELATFSKWRMETFQSAAGLMVINDAYNANPTSMRAALSALADLPSEGRRIAVLGDMAELGSLTELAHFDLGSEIAGSATDILVTVGERGKRIADGALAAGMDPAAVRPCATAAEASEVLDDIVRPGDTVLVKASRVMGLETVVEGMIEPRVQPTA